MLKKAAFLAMSLQHKPVLPLAVKPTFLKNQDR